MNVSLTSDLEQFVADKVESGMYHSASEVIGEALRLLRDWEAVRQRRLEELRREIQIGLEQLERGEYTTYDEKSLPNLIEEIKANAAALQQRRLEELRREIRIGLEQADRGELEPLDIEDLKRRARERAAEYREDK